MADFDLSLVASFETKQVQQGAQNVTASIDNITNAEKRSEQQARKSAAAATADAKAERDRAAAIDAVKSAIDPAYAAQQRMNKLVAEAEKLAKQGAISGRELAAVHKLQAQAMKGGATSAGQARAAYTQLGFQIQDITQTLAMGINPMTVFGQQAGQTAFAISGMGGTLGKVGTFLSGPWGSIILGATTVLGLLAVELFSTGEEAKKAEGKALDFSDGLNELERQALSTADGMLELRNAINAAIVAQGNYLRQNAAVAQATASQLEAQISAKSAELARLEDNRSGIGATLLPSLFGPGGSEVKRAAALKAEIKELRKVLPTAQDAATLSQIALAQERVTESLDASAAATGRYDRAIAKLNDRFKASQNADPLAQATQSTYLSPEQYESEFRRLTEVRDAELEAARESEKSGARRTRARNSAAKAAERERIALEKFGDGAAEKIARLTEQFDEQPKLIDRAAQATRELDSIIADLSERKPVGFADMIAEANAAKGVIEDALVRPFYDVLDASERRMQIDELIAANRGAEAEALQRIWQLEERLGPLSAERRADILATVEAEEALTDELERRQELTNAYLDASRSARQELEAILSGTGKLSNLKNVFQQLKGRVLAEQLFGDVFRDLDEYVREETAISTSVDIMATETERAGAAANAFASELYGAAAAVRDAAAGIGSPTGELSALDRLFEGFDPGSIGGASSSDEPTAGDRIIVEGIKGGVNGLSPERYFEEMTKRVVKPLLDGFDEILGTEFFGKLEGVAGGALNGYLTGGATGGILGALKGIEGLPEGISGALGDALKGSQTGTMVAGLGNAFGLKLSTTGSQIGGAIGSAIPIPGGSIIGSLAGGLLGNIFGGSKRGSAIVTSADGALGSYGNSSSRKEAAQGLGGSVQEGIRNIAEALDASLGAFKVSIGIRNDDYRVDTQGRGYTKRKLAGVRDFGGDADAAIAFAIADAIADGAIRGISPAVARALKSSTDIEAAAEEALKVKNLEDLLEDELGDPIERAFREFGETAKERVELAKRYGVDLLKVEELNAKERASLLEEAVESRVSSLKDLLDDLDFGSLFEGSAAERRSRIRDEIADAKQDVDANVDGAIDRLADLERQLVQTSRSAFGTAGGEYAADLEEARSTAERIIAEEEARIKAAAAATEQQLALTGETNDLLAGVNGRLDSLVDLIRRDPTPVSPGGGGGGGFGGIVGPERYNVVRY